MGVMAVILKLLAVAGLVLLNGFFVAAEFALVKIRDTQLVALIAKGHRRAKVARGLIRNLDATLSATQLGITVTSLGLGWIGEPVFVALLEPILRWMQVESPEVQHTISFVVGFSAITFLHIVAGELAPKSLAIQKTLPVSLWVALPMRWFYVVSYPFNWALNNTALWLLRRIGIRPAGEAEMVHSEDELRLLYVASQKHGSGIHVGRDLVLNAMDLRHRVARDVMRPRQEIVFFDAGASIAECLDVAEKSRYSRFPVCEDGSVDKMLAVVHIKDLYAQRNIARKAADLLPVSRKLFYVPETARLEKLLRFFLERKTHFAIVVDEYGGTVGVVTLENVLEELVGPIQDEFDQEKPLVTKTGENSWDLDGLLPLHELAELTGLEIAGEGLTTVSGWVTQKSGGFPKEGDLFALGDYELRVVDMEGKRVSRLGLAKQGAVIGGAENNRKRE